MQHPLAFLCGIKHYDKKICDDKIVFCCAFDSYTQKVLAACDLCFPGSRCCESNTGRINNIIVSGGDIKSFNKSLREEFYNSLDTIEKASYLLGVYVSCAHQSRVLNFPDHTLDSLSNTAGLDDVGFEESGSPVHSKAKISTLIDSLM